MAPPPPPPPFGCGCDPLCDACVDEQFSRLRGVAQRRGESWAAALARVIPLEREWPAVTTKRMTAMAAKRIADLTTDARLRELLVGEVIVGARRWWTRAREHSA
jgi:hypothetical protein